MFFVIWVVFISRPIFCSEVTGHRTALVQHVLSWGHEVQGVVEWGHSRIRILVGVLISARKERTVRISNTGTSSIDSRRFAFWPPQHLILFRWARFPEEV